MDVKIILQLYFKLILRNEIWCTFCETGRKWVLENSVDHKTRLVRVLAWCREVASHCLSLCWRRSLSPYGVTAAQWFNDLWHNLHKTMPDTYFTERYVNTRTDHQNDVADNVMFLSDAPIYKLINILVYAQMVFVILWIQLKPTCFVKWNLSMDQFGTKIITVVTANKGNQFSHILMHRYHPTSVPILCICIYICIFI